jgi:hypothetical protein
MYRNLIAICTLLIIILVSSGCTKWYDCECTVREAADSAGVNTTTIIHPTKDTEENALEFCNVYNRNDSDIVKTCTLKEAPKSK